jgi:hypothetical protein
MSASTEEIGVKSVSAWSLAEVKNSPASDTERLSAELLERAEALARIADERGAAGSACVAAYEALRR